MAVGTGPLSLTAGHRIHWRRAGRNRRRLRRRLAAAVKYDRLPNGGFERLEPYAGKLVRTVLKEGWWAGNSPVGRQRPRPTRRY